MRQIDYDTGMIQQSRGWLFLLMILALASAAHAAPATAKVSAELNYKSLPPGQEAAVGIVLDVPDGIHAQSHTPLDPNLIPTEVKLEPSDVVEVSPPLYPP